MTIGLHPFAAINLHCATHPNTIAVNDDNNSYTFETLRKNAWQAVNGFKTLGLTSQDRVSVVCKNRYEIMVLLTAALLGGPVIVPINRRLTKDELCWIINDAQSQCIVMDSEIAETLGDVDIAIQFVLKDATSSQKSYGPCFSEWLEQQSPRKTELILTADRDYLQVYTSGTSGFPKGVVLTEGNSISQLTSLTLTLDIAILAGERMYQALPLFHVGGIFISLMCLSRGASLFLRSEFNPAETCNLIAKESLQHAALVPAMIQACSSIGDTGEKTFNTLKSIFYGASPISETVLRAAHQHFNCDFVQIYGMTETHSVISMLGARDHREIFNIVDSPLIRSAGRPILGTTIAIIDYDGNAVKQGDVGEIRVRSDLVMKEYWNNSKATKESIQDGYLLTGDIGRIDDRGYLFVVDRLKDIIVSGGENIASLEVESVLMQHPAVTDAAVIGAPHEKWGEIVLALLVVNTDVDTAEINEFTRRYLSGFKVPKCILFIDSIPRNAGGKILKRKLRDTYSTLDINNSKGKLQNLRETDEAL
ncbi:Long-chain-fatty-acid--CoA ligase FadD13 [Zhongshania aliphaticivorans]|uniref:Long-chain-fatty-acid--CoA ligase FadD13 n=1 Tax=Zhongshania aliphaticivorans TaxID=1470434 RepID=A0A5S9NQ45_9GAMM|nr:AMP-binding protein [Zhongshania aliphaticivorans]CAA0092551.1 Long-chain-fatty-acid--CoA ligase FadD13 [Zhongshania aliphaticivorans]